MVEIFFKVSEGILNKSEVSKVFNPEDSRQGTQPQVCKINDIVVRYDKDYYFLKEKNNSTQNVKEKNYSICDIEDLGGLLGLELARVKESINNMIEDGSERLEACV